MEIKSWLDSFIRRYFAYRVPINIAAEITTRCNLTCRMCPRIALSVQSFDMNLSTYSKIVDFYPFLRGISLFGLGEPLLNSNLIGMMKRAKRKGAWIGFHTNATILNERISKDLIKAGLDVLVCSIDGIYERYEELRGYSFEKLIENIRAVSAAKNTMGVNKPKLTFVMVAMRRNIKDLPEYIELAKSLGADKVTVVNLEVVTDEMVGEELFSETNLQIALEVFEESRLVADKLKIDLKLPRLESLNTRLCPSINGCIVTYDGSVRPCCHLAYPRLPYYYLGEWKEAPDFNFGNVNDKNLCKIWNSDEYRLFRNKIKAGEFPTVCDACLWSEGILS